MGNLVPMFIVVGATALLIALMIAMSKLQDRRRRRHWASGKYGAAGFGAGPAGGCAASGGVGDGVGCGGGAGCGGGGGCGGGS